jgi:hypothetical protein
MAAEGGGVDGAGGDDGETHGDAVGGGGGEGKGNGEGGGGEEDPFSPSISFSDDRTGCFVCVLREACFMILPNSS